MRQFLFILWIFLGFFILYLFSLNMTHVDVDLYFVKFEQTNLVFVMLFSLFIGFIFGAVTIFVKLKKANMNLNKQIKVLQLEKGKSADSDKDKKSTEEKKNGDL